MHSVTTGAQAHSRRPGNTPFARRLKKQAPYQLIVWLGVIFVGIFCYVPMGGLLIAFKDFSFRKGILGSPWAGLAYFNGIFNDFYMGNAVINTVGIFALSLVISLPVTVLFALLLNELRSVAFKRVVQTVSYLPHFISWAIMAVILDSMLNSSDGILNMLMVNLGIIKEPIFYMGRADLFWPLVVFSSIWKELGWGAIVFLAVITGIDESLYEAAKIDGAGRLARMWYITLPALKGIISITLILTVSSMPATAFDQAYFLSNSLNIDRSNVLSYYVYTIGLVRANFSYSTAIGLLLSCISAGLMLSANTVVKKLNGQGLF